MSFGDVLNGLSAALRSQRWTRGARLRSLMQEPAPVANDRRHPTIALRVSRVALRVLGRLPLLPWRNTCLYRSIAACLVLRRCGVPAVLRLGVKHAEDCADGVEAHAWVEGHESDEALRDLVPLA